MLEPCSVTTAQIHGTIDFVFEVNVRSQSPINQNEVVDGQKSDEKTEGKCVQYNRLFVTRVAAQWTVRCLAVTMPTDLKKLGEQTHRFDD